MSGLPSRFENARPPTPVRNGSRFTETMNPVSEYEYFSPSPSNSPRPASPAPQYSSYTGSPPLAQQVSPPLPSPSDENNEKIRSDSPERFYPEVVSPVTPQAVPRHSNDKEAISGATRETTGSVASAGTSPYMNDIHRTNSSEIRLYKKPKRRCLMICGVLLIVIIGLAVGLGVGLTQGKKSSKGSSQPSEQAEAATLIGGELNPKYYSTEGAFNGSGIAITSVNFGLDSSIFVFYQKYTGEIEQYLYGADGSWTFATTVATDARNATALSAVAYIVDSIATWHLFYLDKDRYLKQRTTTNSSAFQNNIWQDGPINQLNLQANDAELVGMQACYWGNYYGSATDFNDGFTPSKSDPQTGMNLWYGRDNSTFEQYDWTHGDAQWNHSRTWGGMNTHAGVGCQSWLTNTTYYVFMIDQADTMRIYWKDTDTNKTSTSSHPIDKWSNTSIAIPDVHPSTSLGYTDFLAYQASDYTIHGLNVSWAAENSTIAPARASTAGTSDGSGKDEWAMDSGDAGIPGTHFAITGLDIASGGRQEVVLYQQTGNDVRVGKRDSQEGDFSYNQAPISST